MRWIPPTISIPIMLYLFSAVMFTFTYFHKDSLLINMGLGSAIIATVIVGLTIGGRAYEKRRESQTVS